MQMRKLLTMEADDPDEESEAQKHVKLSDLLKKGFICS
jgi:hypothetical protein